MSANTKILLDENEIPEKGKARTILFNLCGHGHFDMASYEAYFVGTLE